MKELKNILKDESKEILICLLIDLCYNNPHIKDHIKDLLLKYK